MAEIENIEGLSANESKAYAEAFSGAEGKSGENVETQPRAEIEHDDPDAALDDTQTSEDGKTRLVPHGALHKERRARQELQAQIQKMEVERASERARVDERLRIMQGQRQQAEQRPIEIPDPDQNPVEFLKTLGQAVGAMAQTQQETQQRAQAQDFERRVVSDYHADATRMMAEKPDFSDAYSYLGQSRANELFLSSGGRATAQQIQSQLLYLRQRQH